ncbi:glycosyltransferase [Syntrophotalea carbinolica DSM 2380]|uniref:Glycosyltransferase n=1 Tax=Syntrophotalea carbinolica (strain DSM 2380 / NBRC 103641 / GraBd1) TaxID=338963 RepID=Q3A3L8_SYNC1|nr:glycosyltransferase [Syntrophotalea carbinolica]ABA89039.1 glycosyltransferase [Syntrophotalea carbinolica DSM 2380]
MEKNRNKKLLFYCNWGVSVKNGVFYISQLHNEYLKKSESYFSDVILLSKEKEYHYTDVPINKTIKVNLLPRFESYLSSLRYFKCIYKSIKMLSTTFDIAYLRTPEPFSWLFHIYKGRNTKLVYHYASNPIEAIWGKINDGIFFKILKTILFLPEYLLTLYVAKKNTATCNGEGLKNSLEKFGFCSFTILNESTLTSSSYLNNYRPITTFEFPIKLLYVGFIRPAKGLDFLFEAVSYLTHKEKMKVTIDIVGDGEYISHLKRLSSSLDISCSTFFHGYLPLGEDIYNLYRSSDIFVLPSLSEGSPRVILEAMANCLPVVSTNVGNIPNLLARDRGILVDVKDPMMIKDAIIKLVKDPTYADIVCKNAYIFSKSRSIDAFFNDFSDIAYKDML